MRENAFGHGVYVVVCAVLMAAVPAVAASNWVLDGNLLGAATPALSTPQIISDGAGGAIVAWQNPTGDIYAQRIDSTGIALWTMDGVALCTAVDIQDLPQLASDGAGGAIVTWEDSRGGPADDIYAQRIDASGTVMWAADGVAICVAALIQNVPQIVSDGMGGAIITWHDNRSGLLNFNIYAQRVDGSGSVLWTADGVALCVAALNQVTPQIESDGANGAIVTWQDNRASPDIYARRIDASGTPLWVADGVPLCVALGSQLAPQIASDGAGGAIVAWQDPRLGPNDIFARRINAAGMALGPVDGVALCLAAGDQSAPQIAADGAGGAIVTWQDSRGGPVDIYARRINASSTALWTADGVALCTAPAGQTFPQIVSDGGGGAIVAWQDGRGGPFDIYAQRISAAGVAAWTADGVALCTAADTQSAAQLVSAGAGGAIVIWQDTRNIPDQDIYAQRVEQGYWGLPKPTITSASDVPGDQGGRVALNWERSDRDVFGLETITYYSVWRAVDLVASPEGAGAVAQVSLVGPSAIGPDFEGSAIYHQKTATTDFYWEWVGNQNARYSAGYSFSASTREDSVAGDPAPHYFQVLAHTSDPFIFFESNVMSGSSVDNLAPAAPLMLTAERIGPDVRLRWNRVAAPDLRDYALYRALSSGVTPVPIHFLSSADDTVLIDTGAPTLTLYYIVTAYDVHENQSAASNEASVSATTGVGNTPSVARLTVLDNVPNPFTGATTLRVGLPQASDVEVEVFDVAGRRVRVERNAALSAGWRSIVFDARDGAGNTLPNGVYFYRVRAAGETITRKMVIAR